MTNECSKCGREYEFITEHYEEHHPGEEMPPDEVAESPYGRGAFFDK